MCVRKPIALNKKGIVSFTGMRHLKRRRFSSISGRNGNKYNRVLYHELISLTVEVNLTQAEMSSFAWGKY